MTTVKKENVTEQTAKRIKLGRAPVLDIQVTQQVIDSSVERDSSHCVNADAVNAVLNEIEKQSNGKTKFGPVSVDLQTIRFSNLTKGERYTYLTPRVAQVCLVHFDQGIKPVPFTFRLRGGQTSYAGTSVKDRDRKRRARAAQRVEEKYKEDKTIAELKQVRAASGIMRPVKNGGSNSVVPDKVGGRTPPISIGRRRAFGLRAFER